MYVCIIYIYIHICISLSLSVSLSLSIYIYICIYIYIYIHKHMSYIHHGILLRNTRLRGLPGTLGTLWDFTRPHTLLGTLISVPPPPSKQMGRHVNSNLAHTKPIHASYINDRQLMNTQQQDAHIQIKQLSVPRRRRGKRRPFGYQCLPLSLILSLTICVYIYIYVSFLFLFSFLFFSFFFLFYFIFISFQFYFILHTTSLTYPLPFAPPLRTRACQTPQITNIILYNYNKVILQR